MSGSPRATMTHARPISPSVSRAHPLRSDHVMAVPIHVERRFLVSFVLNRSQRDFSDRDRACLELIRPHLGHLYRLSVAAGGIGSAMGFAGKSPVSAIDTAMLPLTA